MEKSSFDGKIQIDKVVSLLNDFKKAIYDVNYLNKLINQHADDIISSNYNTVIRPFIDKKYINFVNNTNDNINRHDFFICKMDLNNWENGCDYYSSRFPSIENANYSDNIYKTFKFDSQNSFIIDGAEQSMYISGKKNVLKKIKYINDCLRINPNLTYMYQFDTREDPDGVILVIRCFRRDVKNINNWISISASMKLMPYFDNAQTLKKLSVSENLFNFIPIINNLLLKLESSQWTDTSLIKNIWEYSNISNIANTKCLYSQKYPSWNGLLISQCFVPNSNINVQSNMTELFNDLYFYYPSLTVGEIAFSTRNLDGKNFLSICKIDNYNFNGISTQCIKEVKLDLEKFFKKNNIIGDTILDGNLNIKDGNNESVIQTDNVTKNISVHGKVGINQELHEIKGLLDIDNLNNETLMAVIKNIQQKTIISYNVINLIKQNIVNGTPFTIIPDYSKNVIVFKSAIKNTITSNDISFLHIDGPVFQQNKFSNDSLKKISKIINEINRMNNEIKNYSTINDSDYIFSFIELINDCQYNFTTSIKAIIKNNEMYFVMSYRLSQNPINYACPLTESILNNSSQKNTFIKIIDTFSSLNRLINFAILVLYLPNITNNLINTYNGVNTITKYIQNSEFNDRFGSYNYLFMNEVPISSNAKSKCIFHEYYPQWNGKYTADMFFPGTGINLEEVGNEIYNSYTRNYSLNKIKQTFIINYKYDNGNKLGFANILLLNNKLYVINTGVNFVDLIDMNIESNGNINLSGDITVNNLLKKKIFQIDNIRDQITSLYSSGFGTDNPKSKVDINDCGITSILNCITKMAQQCHLKNSNIQNILNFINNSTNQINSTDLNNLINNLINPNTGSILIQNNDNYIFLNKNYELSNPLSIMIVYDWLFQKWNNNTFLELKNNDVQNIKLIETCINGSSSILSSNNFFNFSNQILILDWLYGAKVVFLEYIESNGKFWELGTSVNIELEGLNYNLNKNLQNFFTNLRITSLYLQNIQIRKNPNMNILNATKAADYLSIASNTYPLLPGSLQEFSVDFTNVNNSFIKFLEYKSLNEIFPYQNTSGVNINNLTNINLKSKYLSLYRNILAIYGKNNQNKQLFNLNDYGIINYEDKYQDFISLFYCSDVSASSVKLIFIELQINSIIQPSVDIKGDLRIKGDTYFHNDKTNTDFVSIDTDDSFIGIGTNERYVNYNTSFLNTTQGNLGRHTFIVSGSKFPVAVIERYSEIIPTRDPSSNAIINYPSSQLELFRSKSTLSVRRSSNYYDINELYAMSKQYTTTKIAGPYIQQIQKYNYGADINFEIMDKSDITYNMGKIHVGIDDISNNKILAGFGFSVIDNTADNRTADRNLMYINNNGVMNIDKITLGMDTTTTNNVLLSANDNKLMINDTSLQTIINNEIQKMFSVDADGKLNITYNEKVYICQPK